MYKIGVIEDDVNIQQIVAAYLKKEGYEVYVVSSAEEAFDLREDVLLDMWIVDIMLPGMDGFEFCKKIRNESDIPIIIISAKDEEFDKVLGLELGSDDYLTKPFSPRELVARIKRLFKRINQQPNNAQETIRINKLTIHTTSRRIFWIDKEILVTTKEYDLLLLFAHHPDYAFSREELLRKVWGANYYGSDRAVDDLVKRIRQKMPDIPIKTVWGYGYRLDRKQ